MRPSSVSSGWKEVTSRCPCRAATMPWPSICASTLTSGPDRVDQRRPDEQRVHRAAFDLRDVEVGLEAVYLAAEGIALHLDVHQPQRLAVEVGGMLRHDDQAGAGAPDRLADRERAQRLAQAVHVDQARNRRAFAAGNNQAVRPSRSRGQADLPRLGAEALQDGLVLGEVSLQGQDAYDIHLMQFYRSWPALQAGSHYAEARFAKRSHDTRIHREGAVNPAPSNASRNQD